MTASRPTLAHRIRRSLDAYAACSPLTLAHERARAVQRLRSGTS